MINKYTKGIGILLVIVVFASIATSLWFLPMLSQTHAGFIVSQEMEQEFAKQFLANADVNTGVTIQLLSFHKDASDTQAGEFLDYAVLNHTNEPINFPDAAYGLRIFSLDELSHQWLEVKPAFSLGTDSTIVPPRTESYGPKSNNSFFMLYSDFDNKDIPKKLRIYLFGIGQMTDKIYVAFIDVSRDE